jgi:hypothetical protein
MRKMIYDYDLITACSISLLLVACQYPYDNLIFNCVMIRWTYRLEKRKSGSSETRNNIKLNSKTGKKFTASKSINYKTFKPNLLHFKLKKIFKLILFHKFPLWNGAKFLKSFKCVCYSYVHALSALYSGG